SPLLPLLRRRYRALLPRLVGRPKVAVGGGGGLLAASALVVPFLGEDFLPHFREYDFLMHWVEKPGTSLEAGKRITLAATRGRGAGGGAGGGGGSRELRAVPGVRNFGSHIGRAEVADEVVGPNFTELWIRAVPAAAYKGRGGKTRRAGGGRGVVGPKLPGVWISVDPAADYKGTVGKIQAAMDGYPGLYCDVQ